MDGRFVAMHRSMDIILQVRLLCSVVNNQYNLKMFCFLYRYVGEGIIMTFVLLKINTVQIN